MASNRIDNASPGSQLLRQIHTDTPPPPYGTITPKAPQFLAPSQLVFPEMSQLSMSETKLIDSLPRFVTPAVPNTMHAYYGLVDGRLTPALLKIINTPVVQTKAPRRKTQLTPTSADAHIQLRQAAENGDVAGVRRLLKQFREGALWDLSVNHPVESTGMTALHYAAARGHVEVVKELCEEGGAVVDLPDREGETALMKAAYGGHTSTVRWLVESGASVGRGDRDGWTALHNAAGRGHLSVVEYLVTEAHAPVAARSAQGHTPLMNAASTGNARIVAFLVATGQAAPFAYSALMECAYDVAAIGLHAEVSDILEAAERTAWAELQANHTQLGEYDAIRVHTTQLVSLFENQRARPRRTAASAVGAALANRLPFFARAASGAGEALSSADFSPANLQPSDPAQMTDASGYSRRFKDTVLPGTDWFWLTEWTPYITADSSTDRNGWRYCAEGFNCPGAPWALGVPADCVECVRSRRWVRAMKRQVPLDNPAAILTDNPVAALSPQSPDAHAAEGYLEHAQAMLDEASGSAELERTRAAISVLLANIATDSDDARRNSARKLADGALRRAEALSEDLRENAQHALTGVLEENENALGIISESQAIVPAAIVPDEAVSDCDDERTADRVCRDVKPTKTSRDDFLSDRAASQKTKPHHSEPPSERSQDEPGPSSSSPPQPPPAVPDPNDSDSIVSAYPRTALFQRQSLPECAWAPDDSTQTCRQCARRFTLFVRRHHCRRCGLVFCDSCSATRIALASPVNTQNNGYYGETVGLSVDLGPVSGGYWQFREQRVCDACFVVVDALPEAPTDGVSRGEGAAGDTGTVENSYLVFADFDPKDHTAGPRRCASSIRECPVCDRDWAGVWHSMVRVPGEGWQEAQERHIRECIENTSAEMQGIHAVVSRRTRSGQIIPVSADAADGELTSRSMPRRSVGGGILGFFERLAVADEPDEPSRSPEDGRQREPAKVARSPMGVRYVTYRLNGDTPLLGQECAICFEDFEPGQYAARLNCLCTYHLQCISEWLKRTPACPVHYE